MRSLGCRLLAWSALALLLTTALPPAGILAQPVAPGSGQSSASGRSDEGRPALGLRGGTAPDKHPKLDSRLAAAARASRERGPAAAVAEARGGGVRVQGQSVQVVIESDAPGAARNAAAAVGGSVEAEADGLTRALVPIAALEALAAH